MWSFYANQGIAALLDLATTQKLGSNTAPPAVETSSLQVSLCLFPHVQENS